MENLGSGPVTEKWTLSRDDYQRLLELTKRCELGPYLNQPGFLEDLQVRFMGFLEAMRAGDKAFLEGVVSSFADWVETTRSSEPGLVSSSPG